MRLLNCGEIMKNYYEVLEITENASDEVIRASYRALVKKYHPDNNVNNPEANKKLQELTEAYETLVNPENRRQYDELFFNNVSNTRPAQSVSKQDVKEKKSGSKGFFTSVFDSMVSSINEQQKNYENAYLAGLAMDELLLIRRYKNSSGVKRAGYAKALKEKGVLELDADGKLRPSYQYRDFFR